MIVDDHELVREAIQQFLKIQPSMAVVAEASCGAEMLKILRSVEVDLLILDLQMPGVSGAQLVKCVRTAYPALRMLVMSGYNDSSTVSQVLKAGASGFVSKNCKPSVFIEAVQRTATIGRYIEPEVAQRLAFISDTPKEGDISLILSDRELQVFERIVEGKRIKQIAVELFISDKTVSTHKAHLLEKLGIGNVPDLVKYAVQYNLFN